MRHVVQLIREKHNECKYCIIKTVQIIFNLNSKSDYRFTTDCSSDKTGQDMFKRKRQRG